jgi:CoA:oxalate CoA-transferase
LYDFCSGMALLPSPARKMAGTRKMAEGLTEARPGPLSGIIVIDLTRILAGPYCTQLLAQLGARVIKVEIPERGDDSRHFGPFAGGRSAYFMSVNRGKESIALDLKAPRDREIFEALLGRADILAENFRPGTMEKLGYGWEALHPRFPRLIYAASSGFGHTGPCADLPAYDMVIQAAGGIMSVTGQEGGVPTAVGLSVADITAGLHLALAINAALLHRERTGETTKIDIAMFDCQLAILENAVMRYTVTGQVPQPLGSRHPTITPFEAFPAADGDLVIACGNDALFERLCEAIGRPDLAQDPAFCSNDLRTRNIEALRAALRPELRRKTVREWLAILEPAGIPCSPINSVAEALAHPQTAARNMLAEIADPVAGTVRLSGCPLKFSAFPDLRQHPPAPDLDADRERILQEIGFRE